MYEYKVLKVLKVYDGDTITVQIDLGFHITMVQKLRLARIDAPELRGNSHDQGIKVRDIVREKLYAASNITITTKKVGKYGRYIAEVFVDGENLNDFLLEQNLVELYRK